MRLAFSLLGMLISRSEGAAPRWYAGRSTVACGGERSEI